MPFLAFNSFTFSIILTSFYIFVQFQPQYCITPFLPSLQPKLFNVYFLPFCIIMLVGPTFCYYSVFPLYRYMSFLLVVDGGCVVDVSDCSRTYVSPSMLYTCIHVRAVIHAYTHGVVGNTLTARGDSVSPLSTSFFSNSVIFRAPTWSTYISPVMP